jgi:hypothetical protein
MIFETRFGSIVLKLRNQAGEDVFSTPVLPDDPDFGLVSGLLDLADPGSPQLDGVLNDVRRLVLQTGPIG